MDGHVEQMRRQINIMLTEDYDSTFLHNVGIY